MGEKRERVKQKLYDFICDEQYKPMRLKDIRFLLQVKDADKKRVEEALNELVEEGKITVTPKGKYKKLDDKFLVGDYIGNKKGYGFVRVEGYKDDFFIPAKFSMGAFHGDRVMIAPDSYTKQGKSTEAKVTQILKRGLTTIVGTYDKQQNFGFVIPDNQKVADDIFVAKKDSMGAMTGHKVVCRITNYGADHKSPEGEIIEILGHVNDPGTDILSVVRAYDIPVEYPDKVMDSLKDIPDEVDEADFVGRTDFRALPTVTIDGEDAKDLDDAITLSFEDGVYTLGVHIADVSHYVKEKSPLDKEALKRGTSCYLVDSVIPMLPHKLSNGICSLNAGTDRLTLSCVMKFDKKGKLLDHTICEGILHVDERMTYTNVEKILERSDEEVLKRYEPLVPMFDLMLELSTILRKNRRKRGSIDFDVAETKIIVDENHKPVEIKPYDRNPATKIIEDFMLLANETVAEDYYWQELPFVYRTHEAPDEEKIRTLATFINNFGYSMHIGVNEIRPKEIQKLLTKVEDTPEEAMISRLALRSMKQAKYTAENDGHFGLAANYYTHFTSPIRRYPDLQIHRIIKDNLRGRMNESKIEHYQSILPEVAKRSSEMERRADEAERETIKLKKTEYMQAHIGEEFDGVISGITKWGMYVELPNTIEGLVHVTNMTDDHYEYNEERYEMIGMHTRKVYKLGEALRVQVLDADRLMRTIDFKIVNQGGAGDGEE